MLFLKDPEKRKKVQISSEYQTDLKQCNATFSNLK